MQSGCYRCTVLLLLPSGLLNAHQSCLGALGCVCTAKELVPCPKLAGLFETPAARSLLFLETSEIFAFRTVIS